MTLLTSKDPAPVGIDRASDQSPFLFVGDHAGRAIPALLDNLGLSEAELARHIGWDIGVRRLGEALAERLDAVFIHQAYSRLVADCNRAPGAPDLMPAVSDATPVPGNQAIGEPERADRLEAIHAPYHAAIAAELARRRKAGSPTILVALHSFTPALRGVARPWHAGVLHNGANDRFALALLERLRAVDGLCVGDNQPYKMDGIDYTVPHHAFAVGLAYAEIEVRQDLIATGGGAARWCDTLARALEDTRALLSPE